jgi:2-C-methyl-D-erythritol 4-phosphate cytidylyltransferase
MILFKKLFGDKDTKNKRPFVSAVIVAAGKSSRMNGEDKLMALMAGIPVLAHSLKAFEENPLVDEIVTVTKQDLITEVGHMIRLYGISKAKCVVCGGETRQESALIGVTEVSQKAELIAVHDGARPLVSQKVISDTIRAATLFGSAIPALPVKETIKTVSGGKVQATLEREKLYAAQTPQVFKAELIKAALTDAVQKNIIVTDDSMAVERLGGSVKVIKGSNDNIKITFPEDLHTAEMIALRRLETDVDQEE